MLLMATSPCGRGGATVLATAEATFPRMGADFRATFSLPKFFDNFQAGEGISDPVRVTELQVAVSKLA
jgi:chromate reductase